MVISLLLLFALFINAGSSYAEFTNPNDPSFDNQYFGLDHMAWSRPSKFENLYQSWIGNSDDDNIKSVAYQPRYRPLVNKRRYRPSVNKRRYRPSSLLNQDDKMKRSIYGLWKPAQHVDLV